MMLGFVLLGIVIQRNVTLPSIVPQRLNQFIISCIIPALILLRVPSIHLVPELSIIIVMSWLAVTISALLIILFAKKMRWSKSITGALLMTAVLGNTSYLGFPMVKLMLGESALPLAIIYDQIGTFLALAIYGSIILAIYGEHQTPLTSWAVILKIIKFPPFLALLLALALPAEYLPIMLINFLHLVTLLLIPLTMLVVGLQFQLNIPQGERLPLIIGISVKMLLTPILIFISVFWLPVNELIKAVVVFESAMPPMVTAGVLAMISNLAPRLAVAMVGVGLIGAVFTLPSVDLACWYFFQL